MDSEVDDIYLPIGVAGERPQAGTTLTAIGWGALGENAGTPDILQKVDLPLVSQNECEDALNPGDFKPGMLCAGYYHGGMDTCYGDSGGPLFQRTSNGYKLVGLTSWGYECAGYQSYGVYTDVAFFLSWIKDRVPDVNVISDSGGGNDGNDGNDGDDQCSSGSDNGGSDGGGSDSGGSDSGELNELKQYIIAELETGNNTNIRRVVKEFDLMDYEIRVELSRILIDYFMSSSNTVSIRVIDKLFYRILVKDPNFSDELTDIIPADYLENLPKTQAELS